MAATEQTEIERKYDVDPAVKVPDLTGVDGVARVEAHDPVTLTAVYFDTDGLDLAAHAIALRRREGGGDEGWHIKKPAEEGRTELNWPLDTGGGGSDTVPEEVLEPVRAIVRDRPLSPVARVKTIRTAVHLMNGAGEAVAELADDLVSASDIRGGQLRGWREWEVEFLAAAPGTREERSAFHDAVEGELAAAGAHPSQSLSKLAQALGANSLTDLRSAEQSDRAPDPLAQMDAGSAASVVVAALRSQGNALTREDPAVRADEPDAVHRMRRTIRKLRALLGTYRRLFEEEKVDQLRDDLDRLGAALGEARDAEVRRDRATEELDALPAEDAVARERLVGGDQREYDEALQRVRQMLAGAWYFRVLDSLDDFVQDPPLRPHASAPATREIRKALRRQVKRLRTRTDAAAAPDSGHAGDRDAALHEARKAARRLRYAVTALAVEGTHKPAKKFRRIASAVKPVEKALGGHRDSVIFAEDVRLSAQRARSTGEDAFAYGQLSERSHDDDGEAVLGDLQAAVRRVEKLVSKL
jgi:CHAD domain-containing protein